MSFFLWEEKQNKYIRSSHKLLLIKVLATETILQSYKEGTVWGNCANVFCAVSCCFQPVPCTGAWALNYFKIKKPLKLFCILSLNVKLAVLI